MIRRTLRWTGQGILLGFVLFAGLLTALTFVDLVWLKPVIERAVAAETGRKLTIGGALRLGRSTLPTVTAEDVRFQNAPWASSADMVEARSLTLQVGLLPLLWGDPPTVRRVSMSGATLRLEIDRQGRRNWIFGAQAAAEESAGSAGVLDQLIGIAADDVTLSVHDAARNEKFVLALEHLGLEPSVDGFAVSMLGTFDDEPIAIKAELSPDFRKFEIPDLSFRYAGSRFSGSISGDFGSGEKQPVEISGWIAANRLDIDALRAELPYQDSAPSDPAEPDSFSIEDFIPAGVRGQLVLSAGRLTYGPLDLEDVRVPVKLTGTMVSATPSFLYQGQKASGSLSVSRSKAPDWTVVFDMDAVDMGSLAQDLELVDEAAGTASLKGSLTASGATVEAIRRTLRGTISGTASLSFLDLTPAEDESGETEKGAGEKTIFGSEPIPIDWMRSLQVDVAARIDEILYRDVRLMGMEGTLVIADGSFRVPLKAGYFDDELTATLSGAIGPPPRFRLELLAPRFEFGQLLAEAGWTDLVSVDAALAFDLSGSGETPDALARTLSGQFELVSGEGEIGTAVFELIATDLVWAMIPKGDDKTQTAQLNCLVGRFDFENGLGTSRALVLDTARMTTIGGGTIDLRNGSLDLLLKPKPKNPSLLSLATPIRVRGPFDDISAAPDTMSLLTSLAIGAGAGLLTGGLGAVLPLLSVGDLGEAGAACLKAAGGVVVGPRPETGGSGGAPLNGEGDAGQVGPDDGGE